MKGALRIAFLTWERHAALSGGNLYDRCLLEAWRGLGASIDLHTVPATGGLLDGLRRAPVLLDALMRDYDVVVEDGIVHAAVGGGRRAGRARRVALVHNLPSSAGGPLTWARRRLEGGYLAGVDAVLVNSVDTAAAVRALAALPTHVASPGRDHVRAEIDADLVAQRAAALGPLRVVFLGSVTPHKGLHRLLAALAGLDEAWSLDVVGPLDVAPRYAERLRARAPAERVGWHGGLTGDALSRVLGEAHVMALPSAHEGFGMAYLDAMAFGLVVLATARGAPGGWIADGESGFVLAPDDVLGWRARLSTLAKRRDEVARVGLRARLRWCAQPTWRDVGAATLAWLTAPPSA